MENIQLQKNLLIETGQSYRYDFSFTQADVDAFARLTGDTNPLHIDPQFASHTPFKRPIMHGLLAVSVFAKVLGTMYPGAGTVHLKHEIEFLEAMYVDVHYEALVIVKEICQKCILKLTTQVVEKETKKLTINGEALIMNRQKVPRLRPVRMSNNNQ
jgi:acyl dehydratase